MVLNVGLYLKIATKHALYDSEIFLNVVAMCIYTVHHNGFAYSIIFTNCATEMCKIIYLANITSRNGHKGQFCIV